MVHVELVGGRDQFLDVGQAVLVVSTGSRRGEIYICDGEIIHAQTGQLQGEMALYGLLALPCTGE